MDSGTDRDYLTTDKPHHLRRYIVQSAKAYLCISCWVCLWAVFLIHGPPALNVPPSSGTLHTGEVVDASFGVVLSAGTATVLTIVLAIGVAAAIDWVRRQSSGEQDETTATDGGEDESHV